MEKKARLGTWKLIQTRPEKKPKKCPWKKSSATAEADAHSSSARTLDLRLQASAAKGKEWPRRRPSPSAAAAVADVAVLPSPAGTRPRRRGGAARSPARGGGPRAWRPPARTTPRRRRSRWLWRARWSCLASPRARPSKKSFAPRTPSSPPARTTRTPSPRSPRLLLLHSLLLFHSRPPFVVLSRSGGIRVFFIGSLVPPIEVANLVLGDAWINRECVKRCGLLWYILSPFKCRIKICIWTPLLVKCGKAWLLYLARWVGDGLSFHGFMQFWWLIHHAWSLKSGIGLCIFMVEMIIYYVLPYFWGSSLCRRNEGF